MDRMKSSENIDKKLLFQDKQKLMDSQLKASSHLLQKLDSKISNDANRNKVVDKRSEDMVTPDIEQIALNEEQIGIPNDQKNNKQVFNRRISKMHSHGKPNPTPQKLQFQIDDSVED